MSFLSNVSGSYKEKAQQALENAGMGLLSALRGKLSAWGLSMPIGSIGPIVFEVSNREIRTFKGLRRTTKARYASHEIIGAVPVLEYIGPDGEEITFTMQFSAAWGVNPKNETEKVRELCKSGEANYFVLCNATVGDNPWVVESVSESVDVVDNCGRIITSQIEITMKEYVPSIMAKLEGGTT